MHSRHRELRSALLVAAFAAAAVGCAPPRASAGLSVGVAPRTAQVVVKPGETLWRVARRYGLSADELARRNGIEDPTRVRAGTVLTVPADSSSSPGAAAGGSAARPPSTPAPESASGNPGAPAAAGAGGAASKLSTTSTITTTAGDSSPAAAGAGAPGSGALHTRDGGAATPAAPPPGDAAGRMHSEAPPAGASGEPGAHGTGAEPAHPAYPLRWPVDGKVVARFGPRDGALHDGIDIAAPAGTEIHAAAGGKVIFAGRYGGYGNLVILRHDDGLLTVYARTAVNLVRRGQHVAAGQVIGRVAAASGGGTAQVHFEVREGIEAKNPVRFLPP